MRTTLLLCLVSLLALVAGGGAAAQPASPAPLRLDGQAVVPAANTLAAPVLASGRYVATLAASREDSYLKVKRTIPGSTIWLGATFDQGPAGDREDFDGELFINGYADGNTSAECWGADSIVSTDSAVSGGNDTPHFETWLVSTAQGDRTCRTAQTVTLEFSPYQWTPPADTQVQLVVWEQPPVGDVSGLQAPSGTVTWNDFPARTLSPLRPGTTWAEAPDISDASASFHLDRGQVAIFRMPLDWGQHAQALLSTEQTVSDDLSDLAVWWASPLGGAVRKPEAQGAPGDVFLGSETGPSSYAVATPPVNYRNREIGADDGPVWPSVAGDYFLVVYVGTKGIPAGGLDLTLQSGYYSDYAATAPPYQSPAPPLVQVADFSAADEPTTADRTTATASGASWLPAVLGGGAVLFGLLGVGGLLLRRRRP